MAGSAVARSARSLLQAAPEDRVNKAGEYVVEAVDIIQNEFERESPFAARCIRAIVSGNPYAKSDPRALNVALALGYTLRIAAGRRGVPTPPPADLGAELLPRTSSGEIDWEALNANDEPAGERRGHVWERIEHQTTRDDIYGVDAPMWRFMVCAVTIQCDEVGKLARQMAPEHMEALVSLGYVLRMLDEAVGWDHTIPAKAEPA